MLKAAQVSVLILLLSCSAQAGYMQTGSPEPPPSQPASAVDEPADATQATTADGGLENETAGVLTQVALDVLAALPSLF